MAEERVFDARAERQRRVLSLLERGAAAVLTSDGFRAFLRMQSKVHGYSFTNTLLIMSQRPEATKVNSYKRWQELGRQVQKGGGIKIFYPILAWENDPETGARAGGRGLRGR